MEVIFEDKNIIAINKDYGTLTNKIEGKEMPNVEEWVAKSYPEVTNISDKYEIAGKEILTPKNGIVHRLDKDTTGVLIICRNQEAYDELKSQFKQNRVNKTYIAICYGAIVREQGMVETIISRSRSDFRKYTTHPSGGRGKHRKAVTKYKTIAILEKSENQFSLVQANPKTGRTHQIRVHLKHIGHPIVADNLYAGKKLAKSDSLNMSRQALHAYEIEFKLRGSEYRIKAPLKEDMISAVNMCQLKYLYSAELINSLLQRA